ncbi:MAG TPA: response regulator transcription factor [Candidatus Polarisedimenticolaceae bacterium]
MRVLFVEDERRLAERAGRGLREEGFAVDHAATLAQARELAIVTEYDLVLLDLMLPDGSGLDLLRDWRGEGVETPVLILTARDLLEDKVEGLGSGADDYLTKPFAFEELLARARALLRRRAAPPRRVLEAGPLRVDREARHASWSDTTLDLSPKEFSLLEYFMLHPDVVLSRGRIAEHVWDRAYEARSNTIDVIVTRLRRKLDAAGAPKLIFAEPGIGYALRSKEARG